MSTAIAIVISSSSFILFAAVAIILGLYYTGFFTKPIDCVTSEWSDCDPDKEIQTRTITQYPNSKGKQCGALTQSCIVPFAVGENKSTGLQEYNTIDYLDRQPPLCTDGKAINNYQFKKSTDPKKNGHDMAQYVYNCSDNLNLGGVTDKNTSFTVSNNTFTDIASGEPVKCGENEVIGNLSMSGYAFHYNCLKSKDPLVCRTVTTKPSDNIYKHHIQCSSDEALSKIELTKNTDNHYYYKYDCCKKKI